MRTIPTDDDRADLERLNAEPWMVDCLALNPDYTCWGPGEDYMSTRDHGWATSQEVETWEAFGPWALDDLNECVNFYFEVNRASVKCEACDGSGHNPETKRIADAFYDFEGTGARWVDNVTQDEADALRKEGRLRRWDADARAWVDPGQVTAEEVNAANRPGARGMMGWGSHDAINRWILVKDRAQRLGVFGSCPVCDGHGVVFTEPAAQLGVALWFLHPRKGCSRGVRVRRVTREQLPAVIAYLADAAKRNADRFAKAIAKASP